MSTEHLGVRVDSTLKARIKELVTKKEYRDYSDFVEKAIREKLDRETGDGRSAFVAQLIEVIKSDPDVREALDAARRVSGDNPA